MAGSLTEGLDRIEEIKDAFGERAIAEIECLGNFLGYRPGPDALSQTLLVLYFDAPVEAARATTKMSLVDWAFEGEIYARGYDRKTMQRNLDEMTLGVERMVRQDPLLGRRVKLGRIEFQRGYITGRPSEEEAYLLKRFRYTCQTEQGGAL